MLSIETNNKMAKITYSKFTQTLVLLMTASSTLKTNAQTCNCFEQNVNFNTCNRGQADWRRHNHPDIGLYENCLPEVPVK